MLPTKEFIEGNDVTPVNVLILHVFMFECSIHVYVKLVKILKCITEASNLILTEICRVDSAYMYVSGFIELVKYMYVRCITVTDSNIILSTTRMVILLSIWLPDDFLITTSELSCSIQVLTSTSRTILDVQP